MPRRVFRCADARAAARGGFRVFAKKQGNTEEITGQSGNPSGRSGHPDYFVAGGRSLRSIRDRSALRNESSVSIVFANPAWRSLMVLTKARGPCAAP
jgi:hypothetical protein